MILCFWLQYVHVFACVCMCVYCKSGILSNWCLFAKLANQMAAYTHGVLIFMDTILNTCSNIIAVTDPV